MITGIRRGETKLLLKQKDIEKYIDLLLENLKNLKDEKLEFVWHLEDGSIYDTKSFNGWEWTQGVALYGIFKYYEQTGDRKLLDLLTEWYDKRFDEGLPEKNVNTVAPMLTLAYLFEITKNPKYLPYLEIWAEWVMHGIPRTKDDGIQHKVFLSENKDQLWDDTLMMSVLPLAKIGRLLNRPEYIEQAKKQFLVHIKYLFDKKTGLWFHGWTFDGNHNFADALWGRGNCWVTIVIPEIIETLDLKEGDFFREYLVDTLNRQIETLAKIQNENGLWHTLLTDPQSYVETSATAGFAFGILKAIRKRYIGKEYEETALKAVNAVINNINEAGEVQNVSFGTAMGENLQFYKDIPITPMPYGQSLSVLCLVEYLNYFK